MIKERFFDKMAPMDHEGVMYVIVNHYPAGTSLFADPDGVPCLP